MAIVRFALSAKASSGTMPDVVLLSRFPDLEFQLFWRWRGECHVRDGPALVLRACTQGHVAFVVKPLKKIRKIAMRRHSQEKASRQKVTRHVAHRRINDTLLTNQKHDLQGRSHQLRRRCPRGWPVVFTRCPSRFRKPLTSATHFLHPHSPNVLVLLILKPDHHWEESRPTCGFPDGRPFHHHAGFLLTFCIFCSPSFLLSVFRGSTWSYPDLVRVI